MDTNIIDNGVPDKRPSRKLPIFTGIGIVVLFFLLDDLLGWTEGGGIFSITSAMRVVHNRPRFVDVDSAGLRILFMAGCSVTVTSVALKLNVDMTKRLAQFLVIFLIIGGGFILDGVYGKSIIENFMKGHGYSRCSARDHSVGNGKSKVWFDDYVQASSDCTTKLINS